MTDTLSEALRLAALGWPVFPILPRSKAPATKTGFKAATTDAGVINGWWKTGREYNLGVAMPEGNMILDLDGLASEDLAHDGMLIPQECPVSATPGHGGGRHIWMQTPAGVIAKPKVRVIPGIDVRAHGSYVVVPPSIHPDGKPYAWVEQLNDGPTDLPFAPEWAVNLLSLDDFEEHRDKLDVGSILEGVEPGTRHMTLFRYACRMRALGYHKEEAKIILEEVAVRSDTGDYRIPPKEAVSKIINSVWRRYEELPRKQERKEYTLDRLMATDLGQIQWIVDDLLLPGVCMVWADPKVGKSMAISGLALSIATGDKVWGRYNVQKPRGVLYLDLEQSDLQGQTRWRRLLDGREPPQNIHIAFEWPNQDNGGLQEVRKFLMLHSDVEVVVIDVAAIFWPAEGRKSNAYYSEYDILQDAKKLAKEFNIAVILIHHTNKEGGISGSNAMKGSPDVLMELMRSDGDTFGVIKIGGKNVASGEIYCNVDLSKMRWTATHDKFNK